MEKKSHCRHEWKLTATWTHLIKKCYLCGAIGEPNPQDVEKYKEIIKGVIQRHNKKYGML